MSNEKAVEIVLKKINKIANTNHYDNKDILASVFSGGRDNDSALSLYREFTRE